MDERRNLFLLCFLNHFHLFLYYFFLCFLIFFEFLNFVLFWQTFFRKFFLFFSQYFDLIIIFLIFFLFKGLFLRFWRLFDFISWFSDSILFFWLYRTDLIRYLLGSLWRIFDRNFYFNLFKFRDSLGNDDRTFRKEKVYGVLDINRKKFTGSQRISKFEKICTCKPFFYLQVLEQQWQSLITPWSASKSCLIET